MLLSLEKLCSVFSIFICLVDAHYNGSAPLRNSKLAPSNETTTNSPYWLEDIKHQGVSPFQTNSAYLVFRNVKDFGARGDGLSDDTAAINRAISTGNRCRPGVCQSSTISPAIVYFPAGTYRVSAPIVDFYYTQIIGNPNSLPVIKATSNFSGIALIDGDKFDNTGALEFNSTNVFYRQVRNLVLDTTSVRPNVSVNGLHWPTSQATSLQNLVFRMSEASGTQHQGILIESGE
ncbi:MAG: hypothetical protein Q9191_004191 [Dirinaria sp. TL-2023a]